MKESGVLNAEELRIRAAKWMLENSVSAFIPLGGSKEDYIDTFVMPGVELRHFDSHPDENGDLITMLKGEIALSPSASRSGKAVKFVFFKLLRTYTDTPDVIPEEAGYIIS